MLKLTLGVAPRESLLAIGFALAGAAAFPPVGIWPLMLVSLAGWLVLLQDADGPVARNLGLTYGLTFGLGTMHWLFNLFGVFAIPLVALMAGYFGLLATLIAQTRTVRPVLRAAQAALFAVGIEWIRGDCWYLRFPWYTPPHALAAEPIMIAGARWLGVYGLSALVWFIAAWGAFETNGRRRVGVWAASLILPLFSLGLPAFESPDRVALLLQAEGRDARTGKPAIEQVIAEVPARKADLAVLPELAYSDDYGRVLTSSSTGPAALASKADCHVVFGCVEGVYGQKGFKNVAALVDRQGKLEGTFVKQRPVPLFSDGVAGTERPVFALGGQGTLGMAICYDFDAPSIAASLVRDGATVLAVPTFDAMSWGRVQHLNHGQIVRLRPVETDRWILRAASSGRSETIDPYGCPSREGIDVGDRGHLFTPFAHRGGYPLGARAHVLGPIFAGLTLCAAVAFLIRAVRNRRSGEQDPA